MFHFNSIYTLSQWPVKLEVHWKAEIHEVRADQPFLCILGSSPFIQEIFPWFNMLQFYFCIPCLVLLFSVEIKLFSLGGSLQSGSCEICAAISQVISFSNGTKISQEGKSQESICLPSFFNAISFRYIRLTRREYDPCAWAVLLSWA